MGKVAALVDALARLVAGLRLRGHLGRGCVAHDKDVGPLPAVD